jgi:pimeloyl-ACP methyl ester carboxylesterase
MMETTMRAALRSGDLLPTATLARTVRGSGPGLLVAHGAGGSVAANFGPVLDELAIERTVVGVDYPGSGDTPRAHARLNADELADQLVAAAVAEGLERFAICGFSLGGPIAIRAATRHPDRVTALVLTATFARANARLRLAASTWRELFESGDHLLLAEFLALVAFSTEFLDALGSVGLATTVGELARGVVTGTPEHTDLVERIDVRGDLARISCPTLVISTTADALVAPDLQHCLAAGISDAQVVEIDTGHLPMAEKPDEWQRLITTFLAEHAHAIDHPNPAQDRR